MPTTNPVKPPQFTITRNFDASPGLVWRAWTEPAEFAQWLRPFGVTADSVSCDVRVGGRYRYTMTNDETGERFPTGGEYLEVDPVARLVFTWGDPDAPVDGTPVITLTFVPRGEGTGLTLHMLGQAGEPGDGFIYDGWEEGLANLGEYLASEERTD